MLLWLGAKLGARSCLSLWFSLMTETGCGSRRGGREEEQVIWRDGRKPHDLLYTDIT